MIAKTSTERQQAMRKARQKAGLKELRNLWAYPEDHPEIKAHAAKLQRRRERQGKGK